MLHCLLVVTGTPTSVIPTFLRRGHGKYKGLSCHKILVLRCGDGWAEDDSVVDKMGKWQVAGRKWMPLRYHVYRLPDGYHLPVCLQFSLKPILGLPDVEGIPTHIHSYFYVYFCLHVCLCAVCVPGALRGQERVTDTLRLESHRWFSGRAADALNH